MSEYKGIKVTHENEDDLCNQFMDDSEKEFKILHRRLSDGIEAYQEKYYLIDTAAKLLEEVDTYQQQVSIYETTYMLDSIKALLINAHADLRHISMDDLINKVKRMQEIVDSPLPTVEQEEIKS